MPENERRFQIPVVFEVAGSDREQAARMLHAALNLAGRSLTERRVQGETGDLRQPITAQWFPEAGLKHIDGNTRSARSLYESSSFLTAFEHTPVLDLLSEAFPAEPDQDAYIGEEGVLDANAYEMAFDEFMERSLDLAIKVTRLEDLEVRLQRAELVRDGLADLLERTPLPEEPQRQDYLVTVAPRYAGEIEGDSYDWDHAGWVGDFQAAALTREQELRRLLAGAGGRSPLLPPRFQNEWLPPDLIAIQALRDLAAQEGSSEPPQRLLSRESRASLRAMLHVTDRDIRVRDDEGRELYAGASSIAATTLPSGVYEAATLFGDEPVRLVVGPAGRHNELASFALPRGEHDGAVLDEIARTMQAVPDQELRARVGAVLATVGRSGAQIVEPMTPLEHGVLLSELLRQRNDRLTAGEGTDLDGPDSAGRHAEPDGLSR